MEESAQTMAALLDAETTAYPRLRRGEIIEGVVVGSNRDGVLVDIGAKSEGIIPPQEMHSLRPEGPSRLKPGDKVLVFVLQPETPEGQIILSLDRARGEKGWRILQDYFEQGGAIEAVIGGYNKGGLLVTVEGVNAFVPLSQIASGRPERGSPEEMEKALAQWVGKPILLKVIELNRRRNRAILSERAALQEKRALQKDRLLEELREGDLRRGRITSIRDFGVFVDVGGADGLVHLSELSWERTPNAPQEMFGVGDDVEVYVMRVDQEAKKIALSIRRAQPEQWEDIASNYREGQIVTGQVTKLAPFGAFVRLEGPIEGLIHISELVERRVNHPREVVSEGDLVPVKIVRIEHDRHRLGLSLRQARDVAEEDGWVFNEAGGVEKAPADARLALLGEEAAASAEATAEVAAEGEAAGQEAVEAVADAEETAAETEGPAAQAEAPVEEAMVEEPPVAAEAASAGGDDELTTEAEPDRTKALLVTEPVGETLNIVGDIAAEAEGQEPQQAAEPEPEGASKEGE